MEDKVKMLKNIGLKTMFKISDDEVDDLVNEYEVFMAQVKALEAIDTSGIEPLAYPYEIETTYLREDIPTDIISNSDVLKNAGSVEDGQIKVPKVVE